LRLHGALKYLAVLLLILWSVLPLYWLLNMSVMYNPEIFSKPPSLIVQQPTLEWYQELLGLGQIGELSYHGHGPELMKGMQNSILVAIPVMVITVAVSSIVGYALGRFRFRFKNALVFAILITMAVPPISTLIPYFELWQAMGLAGTHVGLILIYLTQTIPLIMWVLMGFFATLPAEIEKAARVDGCTRFMAFRKVIFPMAAPGIASAGIIAFLISWNEFIFALILNAGTAAGTLPPALSGLFFQDTPIPTMSAALVLSFIPPIIMALILQRYITQLKIVDPVTVVV